MSFAIAEPWRVAAMHEANLELVEKRLADLTTLMANPKPMKTERMIALILLNAAVNKLNKGMKDDPNL
jgi:hypothetical protein